MMPLARPMNATRILVLGFGVTGQAVCRFAVRHSLDVAVSEHDRLSIKQQAWLRKHGIPFEQEGHTTRLLNDVDTIVLSPGIPLELPLVKQASQRGIPVLSETEFALEFAPQCPVIAVTGTNGKSSTVEVLGLLLRTLGKRAWVAGNIGIPLIDVVDQIRDGDVIVLEMSSYQLEQCHSFRPHVGILLNLEPDHIHRHKTMNAYAIAKGKLFAHQESDDVAIMPRTLASQFDGGRGRRVFYDEWFDLLPRFAGRLLPHERSNLSAALAACCVLVPEADLTSLPERLIEDTFRLPHRMETVGFVGDVRIVNDSKSTNAASTIAALRSLDVPVVLMLGGRSKGAGYEALVDEIRTADVRHVILFGEAAPELLSYFKRNPVCAVSLSVTRSMDEAANHAIRVAQPGDVVLLSPACSSFDAFADYIERGEQFSVSIRALPGFKRSEPRT